MKERSRARAWAVQTLYAWETRGGEEDTLVPVMEGLSISPRNRFYASVLIRIIARDKASIDRMIERHLQNWTFERLSVVDRNILRVGVAELVHVDDVPGKVTLQEMIKLAERFSSPESPRFINGVLDAVMREVEKGGAATGP